jgi:hypothetical protein
VKPFFNKLFARAMCHSGVAWVRFSSSLDIFRPLEGCGVGTRRAG